jgi:hypothetical protein
MLCMETPVCLWTTSVGLGDDRRGIRTEAMSERDTGIDELKEGGAKLSWERVWQAGSVRSRVVVANNCFPNKTLH